ncbi:RHS repeat-associated core domain protein [Bacteroidales bacterium Barb4]|nr:RHS repeat-associated core domain protein [Bacteroidales bacterium Barb4]
MNARLYDPLIGRFFSPDPKIMDGETQALNRYSYAMNNPFAYTDPSGEFFVSLTVLVVGAVIGAVAAGVATGIHLARSGASAGEMAWKIPMAMLIGGVAGAAGSYVGAAMYAVGGVVAALSGVASVAAGSLIGSTSSFLTGGNTLSVGLLSYNFNRGGLDNPFGSVQQSIFSALDIAGMVLPAVGAAHSSLTKTARSTRAASPVQAAEAAEPLPVQAAEAAEPLSARNRQIMMAARDVDLDRGGRLLGGAGEEAHQPRMIDPETFVPMRADKPTTHIRKNVVTPENHKLRERLYQSHARNTKLSKAEATGRNIRRHEFRTTDTYYMEELSAERALVPNKVVSRAIERMSVNQSADVVREIEVTVKVIRENYIGFPYSRLTLRNMRRFINTHFNTASINGKTYISLTLPPL